MVPTEKKVSGSTKIGTVPGLLLIAFASTVGIWWKWNEMLDAPAVPPQNQHVQVLQAAAKAQQNAIEQAIAERRVLVGMTANQAREAWGNPTRVNRTEHAYGSNEQWVYGTSRYVYLSNDAVTSVQTSK